MKSLWIIISCKCDWGLFLRYLLLEGKDNEWTMFYQYIAYNTSRIWCVVNYKRLRLRTTTTSRLKVISYNWETFCLAITYLELVVCVIRRRIKLYIFSNLSFYLNDDDGVVLTILFSNYSNNYTTVHYNKIRSWFTVFLLLRNMSIIIFSKVKCRIWYPRICITIVVTKPTKVGKLKLIFVTLMLELIFRTITGWHMTEVL